MFLSYQLLLCKIKYHSNNIAKLKFVSYIFTGGGGGVGAPPQPPLIFFLPLLVLRCLRVLREVLLLRDRVVFVLPKTFKKESIDFIVFAIYIFNTHFILFPHQNFHIPLLL
jgi:hypothetical protein